MSLLSDTLCRHRLTRMSKADTKSRRRGHAARGSYLLRLTPEQADVLYKLADEQDLTVRALLLHRTLGIPLDDPAIDPTPGRKTPHIQESLPMTA